jgi:hypothetical protein
MALDSLRQLVRYGRSRERGKAGDRREHGAGDGGTSGNIRLHGFDLSA